MRTLFCNVSEEPGHMSATTLHTPSSSALGSRTAAIAVTALFAVNGLLLGGYGGALPSLRVKLDLSYSDIAVLLFCGGAAGILSMQIGGRLADAIGARKVSLGAFPLIVLAALALGFAQGSPSPSWAPCSSG
jgi:predicted MFS family arabinose efflux permease